MTRPQTAAPRAGTGPDGRNVVGMELAQPGAVLVEEPAWSHLTELLAELIAGGEWPREPHLTLAPPGAQGELDPILTIDDLSNALSYGHVGDSHFSMAKNGHAIDPCRYQDRNGRFAPDRALHALGMGASLHLYNAQNWIPRLGAVGALLSRYLEHQVRAVIFITPPHAQGMGLHSDAHDVLIVQINGAKRWRVHARDEKRAATMADVPVAQAGALHTAAELHTGDLLYVPRGCPHEAQSVDQASVHVSFAIEATTVRQVLLEQCRAILAGDDFDTPLPPRPAARAGHVVDLLSASGHRLMTELANRSQESPATGAASRPSLVASPGDWAAFFDRKGVA